MLNQDGEQNMLYIQALAQNLEFYRRGTDFGIRLYRKPLFPFVAQVILIDLI